MQNGIHGWLCLDKPLHMSSAQAVAAVRRLFQTKKAGHAGTLDPLATGVLPIAFGEATKTMPYCQDSNKAYHFTVQWGIATTTLDSEGEIIAQGGHIPDVAAIQAILPVFRGAIIQIPPLYSALKIKGQRAYAIARAGGSAEMPERTVIIQDLQLTNHDNQGYSTFSVVCGKGTYVRTLAADIAAKLGTMAYLTALRRVQVDCFLIEKAFSLETLQQRVTTQNRMDFLLPPQYVLNRISAISVTEEQERDIRLGRRVFCLPAIPEMPTYAINAAEKVVALGKVEAEIEAQNYYFQPTRVLQY